MSTALLLVAGGALLAIMLSAIATRSLREFSPSALEEICDRAKNRDRLGQILRHYERVALAAETVQVVSTAVFLLTVGYSIWLNPHWESWEPWLASIGGAVALLAAEVWIPWSVVRLWAEPFLYATWPFWQLLARIVAPLGLGARFVDALLHRLAGRKPDENEEGSIDEDLRTIVDEGHREGLIEEHEREMIEGVIDLADVTVSQVLTPRTDMDCLHIGLTFTDVLKFAVKSGHSRIPIYEKNRDDIVGVLYTKDLLAEMAARPQGPHRTVAEMMRPPYFVPESKPVQALLAEFRSTRSHMAVVLDEYGGVSGVVTIEDVLEEIVGEIVDEYDEDVVEGIWEIDERSIEALARVHIEDINERLGVELKEDGDYDTIGGLVFSALGHIPKPGEEVVIGFAKITVLDVTRRRIEKVRVEVLEPQARESA